MASDNSKTELSDAVLRKRVIYNRWYAKNRVKHLEAVKARAETISAELAEYQRQYRKDNSEKLLIFSRQPEVKVRKKIQALVRFAKLNEEVRAVFHRDHHRRKREKAAGRLRPDVCDVCEQPNLNGRALSFDHCHISGNFRGWLCDNCNKALGFAKDDPEILDKLAAYLRPL